MSWEHRDLEEHLVEIFQSRGRVDDSFATYKGGHRSFDILWTRPYIFSLVEAMREEEVLPSTAISMHFKIYGNYCKSFRKGTLRKVQGTNLK